MSSLRRRCRRSVSLPESNRRKKGSALPPHVWLAARYSREGSLLLLTSAFDRVDARPRLPNVPTPCDCFPGAGQDAQP